MLNSSQPIDYNLYINCMRLYLSFRKLELHIWRDVNILEFLRRDRCVYDDGKCKCLCNAKKYFGICNTEAKERGANTNTT